MTYAQALIMLADKCGVYDVTMEDVPYWIDKFRRFFAYLDYNSIDFRDIVDHIVDVKRRHRPHGEVPKCKYDIYNGVWLQEMLEYKHSSNYYRQCIDKYKHVLGDRWDQAEDIM